MARKLKGQGQVLSGSPSPQFINFQAKTIQANRAPTTADTGYEIGQQWADTTSNILYGLASVSAGAAQWNLLGPGSSDVDSLTGDSGGAISPTGGNINILGGDGLTVVGSGSTLTINRDAEGGYPITPYVVGASGQAGYTTIQSAISAASGAGGGLVFIQPGTYTEDLTLADGVSLFGSSESDTIIIGTHTPPASGAVNIFRCTFQDASAIFSSAAAGTATLLIEDCTFTVTNGFTFDLANWAGAIAVFDIGSGGTNDGFINNTGGATLFLIAATLGVGTGQTMISSGSVTMEEVVLQCPWDAQTGSSITCLYDQFTSPTTFSNNSTGTFTHCYWSTGASAAITMSSSGAVTLANCAVNSSNNPAIAGAGAGTLTIGTTTFLDNSSLAGTLTTAFDNTTTGGVTSTGSSVFDSGTFTVTSGTNAINISADAAATTVNVGTGAAAKTVTIGSANTTSATTIAAGSGGINVDGVTLINDSVNSNTSINTGTSTGTVSVGNASAGAITVDTGAGISLDAATASNFTVTGAGQDLTLASAGGSVAISSTENAASAVSITANGGTSETITVTASQGTGVASIGLTSTAGGITASSGLASTDAINLTASAGGVDIDGALEVNITSSEAAVADAVTISASAADGGITLDAGATPGVTFTNGTQSHQMLVGTGSPNGSVSASQGSLYVDVAGATSTTILFCNTDGGTTWVAVGA